MDSKPRHIAIIMDGNRRWAKEHGIVAGLGHKEGSETLKRITRHANKLGIEYLTVYAFSTENWQRSEEEISTLMLLFKNYLNDLIKAVDTENIRVKIFGNVEGLPEGLRKNIKKAMEKTKDNTGTTLSVALNYGGRDEITRATYKIAEDVLNQKIELEDINQELFQNYLYTKDEPDPDLLIRTSGEMRLSNFLPWQLTYSEFIFINKFWPDFSEQDLEGAIKEYEKRNRKFGGK